MQELFECVQKLESKAWRGPKGMQDGISARYSTPQSHKSQWRSLWRSRKLL